MKKITKLVLSVVLSTGLLAGCNSSGSQSVNSSGSSAGTNSGTSSNTGTESSGELEHAELKMYLIGDRAPDFDEVYGEINKILEEKLNCSISVDFLSWGDHDTKYSLLFSSGEDFDIIFTASGWAHYEQTVSLGGFYPLSEEFIKTNASEIWDTVPEIAWNQAKIGGEIYMIPNYQTDFGQDVIAVRGDVMEKHGIEDIKSWDDLVNFYMTVAEKEDGMYASQGGPYYQYFQMEGLTVTNGTPKGGELILYNTQDPNDLSFTYVLDWDGFADYCKQVKVMADAGCWSRDVLNIADDRQTGLLNGNTAGMIWNLGSCRFYAKQANSENPDWNCTIADPVYSQPKSVKSYINNGVAINASSKNKERAMMVINEFYTNPDVNDLTRIGIEGKHWEAVGDDQFKSLDQSGYGVDNNCNWGWANDNIKRKEFIENRTALDDKFDEMDAAWRSNVKPEHPYDGFNFDTTNVMTQVAAIESTVSYFSPLISGLVDDVDDAIAQLKSALDSAGMQDILDELERQAAEHVSK